MSCVAAFTQNGFRGRNDDGNETTATWKAAQNTNWSNLKDVNLRVRFQMQETAACAGNNKVWQLQYNKNAAGWVTVNASSTNIRSSASANLADAANLTDQLTGGTGTFIGLTGFDEVDGAAGGNSMDVAASGHSEAEFCIQVRSADVANGDTIQLRVTDAGTALASYTQTPTVTVDSGAITVTPGVGALDLTGFAPTVLTPRVVVPGVGALDLTGFAPTILTPVTVTPGVGALDLAGFAPVITVGASITVTPGTGELTLTGFAPVITASDNKVITPGVGALDLTGFAPTVTASDHKTVTPGVGELTLTGFAPVVTASDHKVITPGTGALDLTGFAPTVTGGAGGNVVVIPGTGELTLTGFAPTVTVGSFVPRRRTHGSGIQDWRAQLAAWIKKQEEEKELREKEFRQRKAEARKRREEAEILQEQFEREHAEAEEVAVAYFAGFDPDDEL